MPILDYADLGRLGLVVALYGRDCHEALAVGLQQLARAAEPNEGLIAIGSSI